MASITSVRSSLVRLLAATAIGGALWATEPRVARAEHCNDVESDKAADKTKKNFHVEIKDGQKVYVIDKEITVCGKVPRPAVVYILQPRSINYEWETLKQDFLPNVMDSVKKDPF